MVVSDLDGSSCVPSQGYKASQPDSLMALSTCFGSSGMYGDMLLGGSKLLILWGIPPWLPSPFDAPPIAFTCCLGAPQLPYAS